MNGKALVSGLQLTSMEVSDMLDVIHFFFEQDFKYTSEDEVRSQSKSRESIYENLYGREYKYKYVDKQSNNGRTYVPKAEDYEVEDEEPLPKPFDPLSQKPKAYIPPTEFDSSGMPKSDILDAPLS